MIEIINPLCTTNYDNNADLLYDYLPCHNNSQFRHLNLRIEKSDANAAYFPSLPSIPIPISALYIIPTSLPPSPIQAVIFLVYFLMHSVTNAF